MNCSWGQPEPNLGGMPGTSRKLNKISKVCRRKNGRGCRAIGAAGWSSYKGPEKSMKLSFQAEINQYYRCIGTFTARATGLNQSQRRNSQGYPCAFLLLLHAYIYIFSLTRGVQKSIAEYKKKFTKSWTKFVKEDVHQMENNTMWPWIRAFATANRKTNISKISNNS
jgi:hypothetical protein